MPYSNSWSWKMNLLYELTHEEMQKSGFPKPSHLRRQGTFMLRPGDLMDKHNSFVNSHSQTHSCISKDYTRSEISFVEIFNAQAPYTKRKVKVFVTSRELAAVADPWRVTAFWAPNNAIYTWAVDAWICFKDLENGLGCSLDEKMLERDFPGYLRMIPAITKAGQSKPVYAIHVNQVPLLLAKLDDYTVYKCASPQQEQCFTQDLRSSILPSVHNKLLKQDYLMELASKTYFYSSTKQYSSNTR